MQGSSHGRGLHSQDYRVRLREIISRYAPGARVFDPWENHSGSIDYSDREGRDVFLHHLELARASRLTLCFLPTASLGTAVEMWETYNAGGAVWTISPMADNWVIRFFSHRVFADVDAFEAALKDGALASLGIG